MSEPGNHHKEPVTGLFDDLVEDGRTLLTMQGEELEEKGAVWMKKALQASVKLELTTIPPYLCALWSIEDESSSAADVLRHIVQEEMLHLSLACNLMVALIPEMSPGFTDPEFVPQYPAELAGGVHSGLKLELAPLDDDSLKAFMTVELPAHPFTDEAPKLWSEAEKDHIRAGHETIGEFCDVLKEVLKKLNPQFHLDRQLTGSLAWYCVSSVEQACEVIDLIKHQGEGSDHSPDEASTGNQSNKELSHFYKFLSLYLRRKIEPSGTGRQWQECGTLPDFLCYPMAIVPPGGYDSNTVPVEVNALLEEFDRRYTQSLTALADAWRTGEQGYLVKATEYMFSLGEIARSLMQIPVEGSDKNYGPCFRFRPELLNPVSGA